MQDPSFPCDKNMFEMTLSKLRLLTQDVATCVKQVIHKMFSQVESFLK